MQNYSDALHINIGVGEDISIKNLALLIQDVVGYKGQIVFDANKPDGTPRKLMDVSRLHRLGWKHKINLREGIQLVYNDFVKKENVKVW
jgi:GDP-L-fucose synthase